MAEYIKLKALINAIEWDNDIEKWTLSDYQLDNLPIADVAPVRHGRWEQARYTEAPLYICSECDKPEYKRHKFCPDCGTKMDLEE